MSIRKILSVGTIVFVLNLIGCATAPKKADETGLKKFVKAPITDRKKTVSPKKAESKEKKPLALMEKAKEYFPPKKAQTSAPRHLASAKDIQKALKNAGYYTGKIDGKIGPKTDAAIRTFQKDKGLKVDGIVGRRTWGALNKYLVSQEDVTITPIPVSNKATENLTGSTEISTSVQSPMAATELMKERAVIEQKSPAVDVTPLPSKRITLLAVIVIIILAAISVVLIYRRTHP